MPKRSETKYQGRYYRKRVRKPDGSGYVDVYGTTIDERDAKVDAILKELTAAYEVEQELAKSTFFYEYAGGWYARKSPHMSGQWCKTTKRYINDVICPVIGEKAMAEITSDDLADVMVTVADKSRSYQKSLVSIIKQIFDAAEDAEIISRNPARKLQASGKTPAKKDALSEAQQQILLDAVAGLPVEPIVKLALYTGMRREEICGLCWDCVFLDGDAPHIDVRRACRWETNAQPQLEEILKTDAAWRTIPIPEQLVSELKAVQSGLTKAQRMNKRLPVLHREDGRPLSYSAFRSQWNAITARSTEGGLALGSKVRNHKVSITIDFKVRPHILRKTYITRLILNKVPVKRVQYLAGHESPDITLQIYTDLMEHAPEDLIGDVRSAFGGEKFTP